MAEESGAAPSPAQAAAAARPAGALAVAAPTLFVSPGQVLAARVLAAGWACRTNEEFPCASDGRPSGRDTVGAWLPAP